MALDIMKSAVVEHDDDDVDDDDDDDDYLLLLLLLLLLMNNEYSLKSHFHNRNHDFAFKRLVVHVAYLSLPHSRFSVIT